MDTFLNIFRGNKRNIIILSIIFSSLLAAGVYSYYSYEKKLKRSQFITNLDAITNLKNEEITGWIQERRAEADFFSSNQMFIENTGKILARTTPELKDFFHRTLRTTKNNHSYDDIFIVSENGEVLFSFIPDFDKTSSTSGKLFKNVISQNKIVLREFYFCPEHNKIHLDLISPISDGKNVIAAAVFRINPEAYLYSMIQAWPVPLKTSESLLIKKTGDSVLYLSDLRFKKGTALKLKHPLTNKDNIAANGALGHTGVIEGYDYRNEKVLAKIIKIRGTDWILISKTDESEIYAEVWNKTLLVMGLAVTLILFFISGLTMAYELEEKKMKLKILAKEHALAETRNEYRTMLYSIGDAVITTDALGKIQYMNSIAEKLSGWEEEKAAGRNLEDVFKVVTEKDKSPVENIFREIITSGSSYRMFSEPLLLKSRNGKLIPISDSGSQIKDEEGKISGVVIVFRDQSSTREANKMLQESEQRYRALFNNHHTMMLLINPETGLIEDANPAACNFYGYTPQQFKSIKVFDLNPLPIKEIKSRMREIKEKGGNLYFFKHKLASGELRDVEIYSAPVILSDKEFLFSIVHDVTKRKQAEEALKVSEEKFSKAFKTSPDAISITRISDGLFYEINDGFTELYGFNWEEVKGKSSIDIAIWPIPEEREKIVNLLVQKGELRNVECTLRSKDGSLKNVIVSAKSIKVNGEDCLLSSARDITERKKADEALKVSEEKFSRAFKTSPDAMSINRFSDGMFYEINDGFTEIFGYSWDEVKGKTSIETGIWLFAEDRKKYLDAIVNSGEARNMEFKFCRKDGSIRIGLISGKLIDVNGEECILVVMRDVTEIKKAEEALRLSEDKFSKAFRTSPDSISINKLFDGLYLEINDGFTEITGYTWQDVAGKTTSDIGLWVDDETRLKLAKELITKGEIKNLEARLRIKDGRIGTGLISARRILVNGEECVLSITRDITERKKAEEAIHASEEKFSQAFKTSPDSISINRISDGRYVEINESFTNITGYSWDDIQGKTSNEIGIWATEDDRQYFLSELKDKGEVKNLEARFRLKDGRIGTGLMSARLLTINDELCVLTMTRDITERKKAEEALLASEDKFSKAFKTSPDAMNISRLSDGMFLEINNGFTEATGYTWEDVAGKTPADINIWYKNEDREKLREELIRNGEIKNFETIFRLKDGNLSFALLSARIISVEGQECILSMARDINERKKAEQALKESEEHLKAVTENISDGLIITNSQGESLYWNKAALRMHGFPEDSDLEVLKVSDVVINITTPDGINLDQDQWPLRRIIKGEHLDNIDFRIERKNIGDVRIFNYNGTTVFLANGEKLSFVFITDLTLQRKIEEEARTIEKLLNLTGEMAKAGGWEFDAETLVGTWTDEVARIHDLTPGDPINVELGTSFYRNEDKIRIERAIKEAIELKKPYDMEFEISTFKGNQKIVRTVGIPIIEGGKVVKVRGIFQDITERKIAEATIRENEIKLRLFVEHTPAAIAMFDINMKYIAVSRRWITDLQLKTDDLIGKSHYDLFPDLPERLKNAHYQALTGSVQKCDEDPYIQQDGSTDWLRWEVHPWYTHNNEIGGIIIFSEIITEKILARQALVEMAQLEAQIAKIAVTAPGGLTSMRMYPDGKTVIPYASPIWEDLYDLKAEEVKEDATPALERVHPDDMEEVIKSLESSKTSLTTWRYEFRIVNPKKGILWVEGHSTPTLLDDGSILWHGFITDISQRKQAEQAFLEKVRLEEQISKIAVTAPGGLFSLNSPYNGKSRYLYVSPIWEELHGLKSSEVLEDGDLTFSRIYPDDIEKAVESINESVKNKSDWNCEYRINNPQKGIIWVEGRATPIPLPDGLIWYGFISDITKRKEAEQAFLEKIRLEEQISKIAITAPGGIYSLKLNPDGTKSFPYVSPIFEEMHGVTKEEIEKNSELVFDSIYPEDQELINKTIIESATNLTDWYCEYRIINPQKGILWVEGHAVPLPQANGSIIWHGIITDITKRKEAEQAFFEKTRLEEQISKIATTAPGGIYSLKINPDGKMEFLYVSPIFEELHDLNIEDIKKDSKIVFNRTHPEDIDYVLGSMLECTKTLTDWYYEFRLNNPKRGIIWVEGHSTPLPQPDGSVLWHGFITDITKRKATEFALTDSQEKLRLVIESSDDIYLMQDLEGRYLYAGGSKTTGILPEKHIGKKPGEIFNAEIAGNIMRRINKVVESGESLSEDEYIYWNEDPIWINVRVSPVRNNSGNVIAVSYVIRNITKQHYAEENIKKLSLGIEQSPAIIVITDKNGLIEYTNEKFTQVTGYTAEEVKGKSPRILKSGHTTREEYQDLWNTILAKKEWRGEFLNKRKNGELYWESALISPLLDDKGNILNFIALKEDITELKRINDELIKAKEKAEEMNRLKSYFFANISHELRTPFVGIIGFSELLSEKLQDPGEQKMAEAIFISSKRLTETLNKILDISKLEFDKMEIYPADVNISETIDNLANLYSKTAAKKNINIITEYSKAPKFWRTDERLLREVLNNLINNAVKFTNEGEIKILAEKNENNRLILKVSDTGVGIPEEKQEIIWQEFRQASEGYNRSFEGTGLGLSITKKYTTLLGGTIKMSSQPGSGTEFIIELPEVTVEIENQKKLEAEEQLAMHRNQKLLSRLKVLYVEDDFISIEFVKEVLQKDFSIDIADRPQIALNMIKENFYDAILLDINLGYGMNGIEILQEIKKLGDYKNTPVIAVTAYASTSDEQEFLSKGFTHYLSKPFLSRTLLDLMEKIFSRQDT